jgi:CheY-like chemotaxis protein
MLKAPCILLAEDSDDETFFAERCFAASGIDFELRRATDGNQLVRALEACGTELPRAIILDLKMPLMNGFETLEWIRQRPAYRTLPVIILSSSAMAEDQDRARSLGATEYLVKPHSLLELEKLLKDLAMRLVATIPAAGDLRDERIPPRV